VILHLGNSRNNRVQTRPQWCLLKQNKVPTVARHDVIP